jgi:hypothetical protein
MDYVLQNGLNIGVPYSVPNLPSAFNPATDGCRNITGKVNFDGTVTIYAVTSTVSASGDRRPKQTRSRERRAEGDHLANQREQS